jgi:hypothetical protein
MHDVSPVRKKSMTGHGGDEAGGIPHPKSAKISASLEDFEDQAANPGGTP